MSDYLRFDTDHRLSAYLIAALPLRAGLAVELVGRRVRTKQQAPDASGLYARPRVNGRFDSNLQDQNGVGFAPDTQRWDGVWFKQIVALPDRGILDGVEVGLWLDGLQAFPRGLDVLTVRVTDRGSELLSLWSAGVSVPTLLVQEGVSKLRVDSSEDEFCLSCFGFGSNFKLVDDLELDRAVAGCVRGRTYHDRVRKTWNLNFTHLAESQADAVEVFYEIHRSEPFLFTYDTRLTARRVVFGRAPVMTELDSDALLFKVDVELVEI